MDTLIICLRCGEQNPPTQDSHCTKCGAALPRMDYGGAAANRMQGKITARYDLFTQAAMRVKMGAWSREEFGDWLQNTRSILQEKAGYLVNLITESGYYEYQMDEVELCLTGIEDYDRGMDEMATYLEDGGDVAHLDRGLEQIWEGNEKINEAMRLNREFRRGLEEEWGYM